MKGRIDYYPLVDNPQVKAIAIVLGLFSLFVLLALFNHMPRYGGFLPLEFWLAPLALAGIIFTSARISQSPGGYSIEWCFLSYVVSSRVFTDLSCMTIGKNIHLVSGDTGKAKSVWITYSKTAAVETKLNSMGILGR